MRTFEYTQQIVIPSIIGYIFAIFLASLYAPSVYANTDATKNALAKAQYMLRQMSSEKVTMEKNIAQLKQENDDLSAEIKKLKNELLQKIKVSENQESNLKELKKMSSLVQENVESEQNKNEKLSEENTILLEKLSAQSNNFDICYANNKQLYEINKEILGKYEDKGFWDALSQKEPITAIGKVKIENLIQDYQYKLEPLEVKVVSGNQK